ncbi:GNAT family N-acetyltransferase [Corynebacterium sp. 335C]
MHDDGPGGGDWLGGDWGDGGYGADAGFIEPISPHHLGECHPAMLRSVFWQFGPPDLVGDLAEDDALLEKEAWLSRVMLEWGSCGFNLMGDGMPPAIATVLYGPPRLAPTARRFPTGPVSPDAVLLMSLHIDSFAAGQGWEQVLIGQVAADLAARGVRAIEAFGCSGTIPDAPGIFADGAGDSLLLSTADELDVLEAAFAEAADAAAVDKDCEPRTLRDIGHRAGELPQARWLLDAGFTVVSPHPRHPRLRMELTPDLDWSEVVGRALDELAARQYYLSLSSASSSLKL